MTEPLLLMRDDDWFATFRAVEEPLLINLDGASTGVRDGVEDAWDLPVDQIDGTAARDAWLHIWEALPPALVERTLSQPNDYAPIPGLPRIYGADDTEYAELLRVDVDRAQVQVLADTLAVLQQVLAGRHVGDLRDLLEVTADEDRLPGPSGKRPTPQDLVVELAAVVGVLTLPPGDDTALLLQALDVPAGTERLDLTPAQTRAYRDWTRRWIAASSLGDLKDDSLRHYGLHGSL